jgi:hypothetical protein
LTIPKPKPNRYDYWLDANGVETNSIYV